MTNRIVNKVFYILLVFGATVNVGCVDKAEQTDTNSSTDGQNVPMKLQFALPTKSWHYEGTFRQEGDGPLGKLKLSADTNLTVEKAQSWPANIVVEIKFTWASQRDSDGKWTETKQLGPAKKLPPVPLDQWGRSLSTYHVGHMPLSFIGELWPLPYKPAKIGREYVEQIKSEDEAKDTFHYNGSRKISLTDVKVVGNIKCAVLKIETNLTVKFAEDVNSPPVDLHVISVVVFDIVNNWPLEANQTVVWSGKVRETKNRIRDFKIETHWDLKRVNKPSV